MQITDTILMVRPFSFRRNEQTAVNNYFQAEKVQSHRLGELALAEFDNYVQVLQNAGIKVLLIQDDGSQDTPDSIFPNNIISFHKNKVILYPLFAKNRRRERALNYLGKLDQMGYTFEKIVDYSIFEDQHQFLEGTGAMILDRENKLAYLSISERANESLFQHYCELQGYRGISFDASQNIEGKFYPIYHTNVMMSLGQNFSLICLESILDTAQRELIKKELLQSNKEIIEISTDQMDHFAGNILQVKSSKDDSTYICMSEQALKSLRSEQLQKLQKHGKILSAPLYSIEKYGGGSARCMMAEVFHETP